MSYEIKVEMVVRDRELEKIKNVLSSNNRNSFDRNGLILTTIYYKKGNYIDDKVERIIIGSAQKYIKGDKCEFNRLCYESLSNIGKRGRIANSSDEDILNGNISSEDVMSDFRNHRIRYSSDRRRVARNEIKVKKGSEKDRYNKKDGVWGLSDWLHRKIEKELCKEYELEYEEEKEEVKEEKRYKEGGRVKRTSNVLKRNSRAVKDKLDENKEKNNGEYCCDICAKKGNDRGLYHVHHKHGLHTYEENGKNYSTLEDFETLCFDCHHYRDKGYTDKEVKKIKEESDISQFFNLFEGMSFNEQRKCMQKLTSIAYNNKNN